MLSRGGSGPGGEDGDDDDDDRRYDGQKRDGFISKWLLPTTSERRALSSDSELSQGDDIVSVATNATSAGNGMGMILGDHSDWTITCLDVLTYSHANGCHWKLENCHCSV